MNISRALDIFYKSNYSKMALGSKRIDVKIEKYAYYNNGILLIPVHASMLPDSYFYLVSGNGRIEEIPPLKIARSNTAIKTYKI